MQMDHVLIMINTNLKYKLSIKMCAIIEEIRKQNYNNIH